MPKPPIYSSSSSDADISLAAIAAQARQSATSGKQYKNAFPSKYYRSASENSKPAAAASLNAGFKRARPANETEFDSSDGSLSESSLSNLSCTSSDSDGVTASLAQQAGKHQPVTPTESLEAPFHLVPAAASAAAAASVTVPTSESTNLGEYYSLQALGKQQRQLFKLKSKTFEVAQAGTKRVRSTVEDDIKPGEKKSKPIVKSITERKNKFLSLLDEKLSQLDAAEITQDQLNYFIKNTIANRKFYFPDEDIFNKETKLYIIECFIAYNISINRLEKNKTHFNFKLKIADFKLTEIAEGSKDFKTLIDFINYKNEANGFYSPAASAAQLDADEAMFGEEEPISAQAAIPAKSITAHKNKFLRLLDKKLNQLDDELITQSDINDFIKKTVKEGNIFYLPKEDVLNEESKLYIIECVIAYNTKDAIRLKRNKTHFNFKLNKDDFKLTEIAEGSRKYKALIDFINYKNEANGFYSPAASAAQLVEAEAIFGEEEPISTQAAILANKSITERKYKFLSLLDEKLSQLDDELITQSDINHFIKKTVKEGSIFYLPKEDVLNEESKLYIIECVIAYNYKDAIRLKRNKTHFNFKLNKDDFKLTEFAEGSRKYKTLIDFINDKNKANGFYSSTAESAAQLDADEEMPELEDSILVQTEATPAEAISAQPVIATQTTVDETAPELAAAVPAPSSTPVQASAPASVTSSVAASIQSPAISSISAPISDFESSNVMLTPVISEVSKLCLNITKLTLDSALKSSLSLNLQALKNAVKNINKYCNSETPNKLIISRICKVANKKIANLKNLFLESEGAEAIYEANEDLMEDIDEGLMALEGVFANLSNNATQLVSASSNAVSTYDADHAADAATVVATDHDEAEIILMG